MKLVKRHSAPLMVTAVADGPLASYVSLIVTRPRRMALRHGLLQLRKLYTLLLALLPATWRQTLGSKARNLLSQK